MCGICGYFGAFAPVDEQTHVLTLMTETLTHRGPDSSGLVVTPTVGLGVRRLSLVDLERGDQPMTNEDGSVTLVCNGEIYEHEDTARRLRARGHQLRTRCDVEVLAHLYEEDGAGFLAALNGQFALALYDARRHELLLARDHAGISPLFYTSAGGVLWFASEIKALLANALVPRRVDLTGLDQVLCFPGLVSPTTMFAGIRSIKPGHYLTVTEAGVCEREYWDLRYPATGESEPVSESSEQAQLDDLRAALTTAVRLRLKADVPVGLYVSGGLDSSLIAALAREAEPEATLHAFGVEFDDDEFSERPYQRLVARTSRLTHHPVPFGAHDIVDRLPTVIAHCECPIKETYNAASLALSDCARRHGVPAVLSGEGADELFAGYVGYKFDRLRTGPAIDGEDDPESERRLRERLWGDGSLFYEKSFVAFRGVRRALYSDALSQQLEEFDCTERPVVEASKIAGRDRLHQRSYLDFKLRMGDHLLGDHGDRMALANSVEARYPFLDRHVIHLAAQMPASLKLRGFTEKYALRQIAERLVPARIIRREKQAFVAPGTFQLMQRRIEWIEDMLSGDRVRRDGYFSAAEVERLKTSQRRADFSGHPSFDTDLLAVVLTFGVFLDAFDLPRLN